MGFSSSSYGILQARILEWVAMPYSKGSSQSRGQTQVSPLQEDSLLSEPPGKPKNTGVGSLSFLQGILLTQELNQGLLHCGRILYQLSYQGSPDNTYLGQNSLENAEKCMHTNRHTQRIAGKFIFHGWPLLAFLNLPFCLLCENMNDRLPSWLSINCGF